MADDLTDSLIMHWTGSGSVDATDAPDELVYETSGQLYSIDASGGEKLAGRFRLYYVDVDRSREEGHSLFDVFDAHSSQVAEYYPHLFNCSNQTYSSAVLKTLSDSLIDQNLLILDSMEILPDYRGRKVGLAVMRELMRRFAFGAGVVAIKPFPLQFSASGEREEPGDWAEQMALDVFTANERVATARLREYYSRLGFVRLGRTPIMIRGTTCSLPTLSLNTNGSNRT